jgi:hypothetical protein
VVDKKGRLWKNAEFKISEATKRRAAALNNFIG